MSGIRATRSEVVSRTNESKEGRKEGSRKEGRKEVQTDGGFQELTWMEDELCEEGFCGRKDRDDPKSGALQEMVKHCKQVRKRVKNEEWEWIR